MRESSGMVSTVGLERGAELLGRAAWALATGTTSLPERLTAAWVEHLAEIRLEDLPADCRELWQFLVAEIHPDMPDHAGVEVAEELLLLLEEVQAAR